MRLPPAPEAVGKFVSLVFSGIVSEPRAVATGSRRNWVERRTFSNISHDPVATARGSDTSRHRGPWP